MLIGMIFLCLSSVGILELISFLFVVETCFKAVSFADISVGTFFPKLHIIVAFQFFVLMVLEYLGLCNQKTKFGNEGVDVHIKGLTPG